MIAKFLLKKDLDSINDDDIMRLLIEHKDQDDSSHGDIRLIIRESVKMDLKIKPPMARIMDMLSQLDKVIDEHNCQSLFESDSGKENWIRLATECLQPYVFKNHMLNMINFVKPDLRKDPVAFVEQLKADAVKYESEVSRILIRNVKTRDSKANGGSRKHKSPSHDDRTQSKKRRLEDIECLKCHQKGHVMKNCHLKPSADEQSKLLQQSKALRKVSVNKTNSTYLTIARVVDNHAVEDLESRIQVSFAKGRVLCYGILDSGADATILPYNIAEEICRIDKQVSLMPCSEIISARLPDGREIEISQYLVLDITLQSKAGPIDVSLHRCLVWKTAMKELIIGNDLLTRIGCDPKKALDALVIDQQSRTESDQHTDNAKSFLYDIGIDDESDIVQTIKSKVQQCLDRGLPNEYGHRLLQLLIRRKNVFRRKLGPDRPADVAPFVTKLVSGAEQYRCKARHYSAEQSEFLHEFTKNLERFGLVYENPNCEWASPVVVVKKHNGYRMCVELRAVNALSVATVWPLPFLQDIVQYMANSRYWFIFDAFKGFWMMPLAKQCQKMFSFMTDRGVFTPTRSIQGALNSAVQFQARMTSNFKDLFYKSIVVWIDDILGHSNTVEDWFPLLDTTLQRLEKYNIKLNIDKCNFFVTEVKFCGRIFRHKEVIHDPVRIQALVDMPSPKTASELQQLLMATQWMSRSIPRYNEMIYKLQELFESAMKGQIRRTKSVARKLLLDKFGWNAEHELAIRKLKSALVENVRMAFPNDEMIQCVFFDASYEFCSGMVTQIPVEDESKPISEQRHQPLGFVGHKFKGSELNWAIVNKEAFAIKDTLHKLSYLLHMKRPFKLFTDHRNLISMFNPTKCNQPSADRLLRWGIQLREFNYVIRHISGEVNCWADILSRWGAVRRDKAPSVAINILQTMNDSADEDPFSKSIDHARVQPLNLQISSGQTFRKSKMSSGVILATVTIVLLIVTACL